MRKTGAYKTKSCVQTARTEKLVRFSYGIFVNYIYLMTYALGDKADLFAPIRPGENCIDSPDHIHVTQLAKVLIRLCSCAC